MLSRVADSVYWMSRYLERAEHTARLVDVQLNLLLDQSPSSAGQAQKRLLDSLGISLGPDAPPLEDALAVARLLTFDTTNSNSLLSCIVTARENARQVREQISSEMYQQINRLYLKMRAPDVKEEWALQPYEFFNDVKQDIHLFHGITAGTLSHGEAWQFIRLGRSLERAGATANLMSCHARSLTDEAAGSSAADYLEWVALLRSCTSFEAYCREYTADLRPSRIVEFLLLDADSPRSVRHCADRIQEAIDNIAEVTGRRKDNALGRAAGKLRAKLDYARVEEVQSGGLLDFLMSVRAGCGEIHRGVFATYIGYTVEVGA